VPGERRDAEGYERRRNEVDESRVVVADGEVRGNGGKAKRYEEVEDVDAVADLPQIDDWSPFEQATEGAAESSTSRVDEPAEDKRSSRALQRGRDMVIERARNPVHAHVHQNTDRQDDAGEGSF